MAISASSNSAHCTSSHAASSIVQVASGTDPWPSLMPTEIRAPGHRSGALRQVTSLRCMLAGCHRRLRKRKLVSACITVGPAVQCICA